MSLEIEIYIFGCDKKDKEECAKRLKPCKCVFLSKDKISKSWITSWAMNGMKFCIDLTKGFIGHGFLEKIESCPVICLRCKRIDLLNFKEVNTYFMSKLIQIKNIIKERNIHPVLQDDTISSQGICLFTIVSLDQLKDDECFESMLQSLKNQNISNWKWNIWLNESIPKKWKDVDSRIEFFVQEKESYSFKNAKDVSNAWNSCLSFPIVVSLRWGDLLDSKLLQTFQNSLSVFGFGYAYADVCIENNDEIDSEIDSEINNENHNEIKEEEKSNSKKENQTETRIKDDNNESKKDSENENKKNNENEGIKEEDDVKPIKHAECAHYFSFFGKDKDLKKVKRSWDVSYPSFIEKDPFYLGIFAWRTDFYNHVGGISTSLPGGFWVDFYSKCLLSGRATRIPFLGCLRNSSSFISDSWNGTLLGLYSSVIKNVFSSSWIPCVEEKDHYYKSMDHGCRRCLNDTFQPHNERSIVFYFETRDSFVKNKEKMMQSISAIQSEKFYNSWKFYWLFVCNDWENPNTVFSKKDCQEMKIDSSRVFLVETFSTKHDESKNYVFTVRPTLTIHKEIKFD